MRKLQKITTGACLLMSVSPVFAQEKPNIIFIYADDLGYSDLQCYGSPVNKTPCLDKMANEGIRFTDFYSAAPVSTPSRAGLMTGRYPSRMGINHVFFPHSFTGMSPDEITMAEMLKEKDYETAIFGKWHLGTDYQFLPKRQGFDEFFGTVSSIDNPPFVYLDGDKAQDVLANKDSATITITNKALDYIERKKDKPFFCYVAYHMPHVPLAASPRFKGKSQNGLYGDVIMELDWAVGEILKKVEELGLSENTIIAFSSDNGPWLSEGPNGGCALPLYRGKGTTWDGGQRVPMIVKWKGHIKPAQVEKNVAVMVDWFPTFANLTGGNVPKDRPMDGCNIAPVLLGAGKRENQDFVYITFSKVEAFRSGDWKLKMPEASKKGNYWQTDVPAHDTILVNLRTDIGEKINLKDQYPDIVKKIACKIDSFKQTHIVPKPIFQWEMETDKLTQQQRIDAVLDAKKKGIAPKSENGEIQLEYYEAIDKFQKKKGSIF
mgnify:CR=1 FL=1